MLRSVRFVAVLCAVFFCLAIYPAYAQTDKPLISDEGLKASRSTGATPLGIKFSDTMASKSDETIVSWEWDFGDGETSNQPTPKHVYKEPGIYTPTLITTTASGATIRTMSEPIVVEKGFDSDKDGISDQDELAFGTSASTWDSDGDTFSDGDELMIGTNPNEKNADLEPDAMALDGNPDLQLLGKHGNQIVLLYTGPPNKSPILAPGMKLISNQYVADMQGGDKGWWNDALGFCVEIVEFTAETVEAGQEIFIDGVSYLAESTADGIVFVVQTITTPLVEAFANMDIEFTESFSVSTDDEEYFPDGSPLTGRVLYEEGPLEVVITHGLIQFSPEFEGRILIEGGELTESKFVTTGTFYATLDVRATVDYQYNKTFPDLPIATAVIPIGNLPIKIDLD